MIKIIDFSYYPKDCKFYDASNKKFIGKFKDETDFEPIIELIGLRSKCIPRIFMQESKKAKETKRMLLIKL